MEGAKDSVICEDSLRQDYLENPISTGNKSQSHSLCSNLIWHSSEIVKKYLTFYQRLHILQRGGNWFSSFNLSKSNSTRLNLEPQEMHLNFESPP